MQNLSDVLSHSHSGKVRDLYTIPDYPQLLAIRASDRASTHNVKHRSEVPGKGELLTALSIFWLDIIDVPTHLVAWGRRIYDYLPNAEYAPDEHYRTVVVHRRKPHPREFIYRSFLTGRLLEAYTAGKDPYGLGLPDGLVKMSAFDPPVFTPTRKSKNDKPVLWRPVAKRYPRATALTRKAYDRMGAYLAPRGITLIDGKSEADEDLLLDEWGTGDCCRMAFTSDIREGEDPPWLDKEYLRQAAARAWGDGPRVPLVFDAAVIRNTVRRYHDGFEAITGMTLAEFKRTYLD